MSRRSATAKLPIVVNSAGCGATLKEYGHLFTSGQGEKFAARVRDVSELLAERGPVPGAPLDLRVAYDPPCHLLHAQRIADAPLRLFQAIPVLQLVSTPDAAQCCGSAGLFTFVQPGMSRAVLGPSSRRCARRRRRSSRRATPGA